QLLAQPRRELARFRGVDRDLIFDVVADDLLSRRMRHAAEDANFRRSVVAVDAEDAAAVDAFGSQLVDELVAHEIASEDGDGNRDAAEGENIVDCVAGAAE